MDEENIMPAELLSKPANGETLVALYDMIKTWVLEQLASSGDKLDEEAITTIVNNILDASDFITEADATTIVDNAISSANSLTEERVQEMIDESVGVVMAAAY